jgi:hypothetical protein
MPEIEFRTMIRITLKPGGKSENGNDYQFDFVGGATSKGDFDFTSHRKPISIVYEIDETNSVSDVKFVRLRDDPFLVAPQSANCPTQKPAGRPFVGIRWESAEKKRIALVIQNTNDDKQTYRYALNFVRNVNGTSIPIQCDPEIKNGEGETKGNGENGAVTHDNGSDHDAWGNGFGGRRPVIFNIPIKIKIG